MHLTSYSPIIFIIIVLVNFEQVSPNSQFCSSLHTTNKQDKCPDPLSFDILKEYTKPLSSWKLNIPLLLNKSDITIIQEIKNRFNQSASCPYIRQTNKTICCEGWQGPACDQPGESHTHPSFATCHLWGRDQIRTFDGTYYQFPGSCTYKLTGSTTWQMNIQFINCTTLKNACQKKITIVISGKTLEITGTKLTNITAYPSSLTIRRQEKHFLDLYFTNGIRLKLDQNQIILQLDQNLMLDQSLSGLCGDYNNNQEDDLKLLTTGVITSVPVDFGNQWKLDQNCPDVPPVINSCSIDSKAVDECIPLTNQSKIFQSCFEKIDPAYFYQACLNDVCSATQMNKSLTNARCRALEAYIEECQEYNIHLQWRSKTGCSKKCSSPNMVYVECASTCPQTCQNPSAAINQCHTQNNECTPGCVCSNGTVYDSTQDECIPLEQCSCQYNNLQYQFEDEVSIDCNDCKCDHGRWLCTNRTCPRTCLVLGDMNILTFDGKRYALVSNCQQVLVETSDQSNYLRITYTNQGNELNIQLLNTKIVFHQGDVLINGNIRHTLPYQTEDAIIRRASTVFIEVRDILSTVVVHFDSLTSRIYVKLQPSFVNRVRGLCGTFNYITNDDFLTPNNVIETNLVTFANAYLASSCSVPDQQTDACFNFPANEQNARTECTNLLKNPIFSTCSPLIIDPIFFINSCIRDLCADQSSAHSDQVKCSVITALAHACALKGIQIDWMSNETLANTCQTIHYGQCGTASRSNYSECVSDCQSSCTDIDLMPSSCVNQCLPGCKCQSGQFYDEHSLVCRTQNECPCYESQSEQYIHPSHSLLIKTPTLSNCSCSNGSLQCTSFDNKQCAPTQIYSVNATSCPRTCANYLSHYDCGLYAPGCTCPPGQILLDSKSNQQNCIPIDQCPCEYNRQVYLENETIIQTDHGCQNCTCQKGGLWSCKTITCTKTCTIFGHAHYQTFDGLYYNFPGQCQYILVTDAKNLFRILSQNIPCGTNGQICSKNILIEYNGIVIDLVRGRPILVNDIELLKYQIQPVTFGAVHIYQLGIYTIIKTDDFTVKWDGQTYVDIIVQSNNEMSGLCGNNNDNFDDDLKSANGATQINVFDMAKSWQTSAQCTLANNQSISSDPCGDSVEHEQRRAWAHNKCDLIKIKSSILNNPFEMCIDKMETSLIEKYYQACLYDACHADHGGDCEAVCTVLSSFATKCQSIIGTPIIKWRTADRCPMQCDSDKVYMPCGPLCPQTCFEDDDYGGCIADSGCVDGCFCPNGQLMDNNGQCIDPRRCPCLYDNKIYPESSRIMMMKNTTCHHECECQNGSFACDKNESTSSCITTNCTNNQFTCESDGQCIPLNWKCDQIEDCEDGSDELKDICQQQCLNRTNKFQCSNEQCIDIVHRCDGLPDCRDGSDEVNCSYVVPCKEYQCPISKLCIPKTWICDGTVDCGHEDSSDESGDCKLNQCDTLSGRYFQCRDNFNCLPIEQRCDAHKDCDDGSDESDCSSCTCTSSFSCIHTCQCIDSRRVCDGISDCIDRTDELNCTANCALDEYTCLDGKCLNRTFLCDGIRHCSKGEDETHPDCSTSTTGITMVMSTNTPAPATTKTTGTPGSPTTETTGAPGSVTTETTGAPGLSTTETSGAPGSAITETTGTPGLSTTETSGAPGSATTETSGAPSSVTTETTGAPGLSTTETTGTPGTATTETTGAPGLATTETTGTPGLFTAETTGTPVTATTQTTGAPGLSTTETTGTPGTATTETTGAPGTATAETTGTPVTATTQTTGTPGLSTTETTGTPGTATTETTGAPGLATTETTAAPGPATTETIVLSAMKTTGAPGSATTETTGTSVTARTKTIALSATKTTVFPTAGTTTTTEPKCEIQSALVDDRFISKPKFSTPIIGSISDLNPGKKGIDFIVITPSTAVVINLPLKKNTRITNLMKLQILRPSNVNRFRLTFLNKQNQPIGQYQILSTESKQSSISPTIDKFPIITNLSKEIRSLKIEIIDTDDNRPPNHVTLLFQACFKQKKIPTEKNCTPIDAFDSHYTSRIIAKLGGTRPMNSTYGNLLLNYGGVTYNTSQAVIDIRIHNNILSRLNEISIPDYVLKRTNVKKIIVEAFDQYHKRLFLGKTSTMLVKINSTKKLPVRFIRISILETNDDYAPFNVTVSIKGCFYRKNPEKKSTKKYTKTTEATTKSTCYHANALDPLFAHKIIGQFEGTQPLPGLSFVNFIEPSKTGVDYAVKSPVILIRFQSNVIGQLDEIALVNHKNNIKQFQIDLFDLNNNLLFSNRTIYSEQSIKIPFVSSTDPMLISTIQITILSTTDNRPARGIILSITGCFSTFPRISTTTTTTTTIAPTTTKVTTKRPRDCNRIELMNNSNIIVGIASKSQLTRGNLGTIGQIKQNGVTFSGLNPSIDIVLRSNVLIYLNYVSIISTTSNLKRFRIELLNNENDVQYKIESSTMTIDLASLPSMVLAGIRLTFLQTNDNQPPRDIVLSIQACVEEILIKKSSTTTPASTTRRTYPKTTPITPDHCADIDAMQEPYSEKTLAGLSGTNPVGVNSSLLDLIYGKSISFNENDDKAVIFIIFKSDLFVYLKHVGLSSIVGSNVKRIQIEYLDKNQLPIRTVFVDYTNNKTTMEPTQDVGSVKITIEETYDGKSAKNVRLSVRGCFGIQPHSTTTTVRPSVTTPTPTPCHHLDLMSNKPVVSKVVAYIAGTNPISSSIFDYFNSSTSISYTKSLPTFIIVFKSNIYVDLKSILITNKETNVRKYQIDLIDNDRTILQTIIIDKQQQQSNVSFYVPIAALQITYLETTDGQTPRNIILSVDGCFGINLSPPVEVTTEATTTRRPLELTTPHCHEIDMMNKLDSTILVDSITGTLPTKTTNTLSDYFNPTSLISYASQKLPITFLIILKSTVYAEIQSVSLISSTTNVKRFQVDLIDDYKSIVQTIESNQNLTVDGLTEVGIAAIQISYIETKDNQPPKNIRLSIKGCFGILPSRRRTTPAVQSTTTKGPQTTKITKRKCTILDAMSSENRNKLLRAVSGTESLRVFSPNGLSFNSTTGSIDIAFKEGIISNIDNITILGKNHNIKKYRISFFDINDRIIDERLLTNDKNEILFIDHVATVRIVLLETIDNKNIHDVKFSIRGCFFKIPNFRPTKSPSVKTTKPAGHCQSIELMDKLHAKRLLNRIGGNINLSQISNSTIQSQNQTETPFFILEFNKNIFIRNIQNLSILTKNHQIQQIRIELHNKNRQLLKRIDLSPTDQITNTNLYSPIYPINIKYLKVTILKGKVDENLTWSIIGCFDRIKKIKTSRKTLKLAWWTVTCIHSNIMAGRDGYHPRQSLTPSITGTPSPIGGNFQNLMTGSTGISYAETQKPITIEIDFPPGIIGRLYEVGIESSNVYRIRVQLVEVPNGLLYTLTSPENSKIKKKIPNPRLTGFPPVHSSGIRIVLLDTIDGRAPRNVKIFTNGCFYKSSVKYTTISTVGTVKTTTKRPKTSTTVKPSCRYSEWTRWAHCSVSCGNGVQIRARNRISGNGCNGTLMDYRMCQLQPCMCVLTKEFYMAVTGQKVPVNDIVGYLKDGKQPVHIGDILDTGTIVYTYNCSQFICSNVGLDMKRSTNCQQKCVFLPWSPWGACQGDCGNKPRKGIQLRQRLPIHIFAGSHICVPEKENRSCQTSPCFGSCILSSWSKWSPCSKSCDLGIQKRSRYYVSIQPNCTDKLEETRDCNPQCCTSNKKPTWSEWNPWRDCSKTCDGGERIRYRTCKNDTSKCSQQVTCPGSNKQIEPCNTQKCPTQLECTNGKVMNNCSNACGHTCNTLSCRSCNEPSICLPGCVCPAPLVLNAFGECVETKQCLCQTSDGKVNLISGQSFTDSNKSENCLCSNGCLDCHRNLLAVSACSWSDWSPFGVCSAQCNGTQTRYRSRSCNGATPEIEHENQTCSTNETSYKKGCAQCSCDSTTGQEACHVQCAITPDICSNLTNDPLAIYQFVPPIDGQCCGLCNRTNKTEPCSVQVLPLEQVSSGDCMSVNPIARQQCLGTCISGMSCRCCSPSEVTVEQIPMECQRVENNSTITFIQQMSYAKINSCSCQECNKNF